MPQPLSSHDRERYQWQLWVNGFTEAMQSQLRNASVLVSRVGGVGGVVAHQLAAAGVGRIVLAHAGPLRLDDLNRQLLMSESGLGESRAKQAAELLQSFNSQIVVEAVEENITSDNVDRLVGSVDAVVSCAPLFEERLLMNRAAVRQRKPLVNAAVYDLELQVSAFAPGGKPCLACMTPPPDWKRQFPVFGAVSGTAGAIGAMEMIKILSGLGESLAGKMLVGDLGVMSFKTLKIWANPDCPVCGGA